MDICAIITNGRAARYIRYEIDERRDFRCTVNITPHKTDSVIRRGRMKLDRRRIACMQADTFEPHDPSYCSLGCPHKS
jgi:hypothetical protein